MEMDFTGWAVTAFAILITGISKSALGGAIGGLAVPLMSVWISPRDAVAVTLPVLIAIDLFGIRAWRGKADWGDLRLLIPSAVVGIVVGTLTFGMMSERVVKLLIGSIAICFVIDRLVRRSGKSTLGGYPSKSFAWACGAGAGFTSTLAHAGGPPIMIYLLRRDHVRQKFVATAVFFFAVINLAKVPFFLGLGLIRAETLLMSAILLPLVPLGVWSGTRILSKLPDRLFYLIATGGLAFSGIKLLWDGVVG